MGKFEAGGPGRLDDSLRLVFWETTAACNLQCAHCRRLEVSGQLMHNDLTTEQARQMISDLADFARPILVFSGGEPLMRPDIYDLAEFAGRCGLTTALASNGTMIDAAVAGRIRRAGFRRVSVSLDGADEKTHDVFRQQVGSFGKALAGLEHLHRVGVSTQINCTIARHNAHQLADLLELGRSVHVQAVHYFLLVPVGCGQQIAEQQMLSAEQVEALLKRLAELAEQSDLQVKATCAPHYYRIVRQVRSRRARREAAQRHDRPAGPMHTMTRGCLAGVAVCFVSHKGEVFPCGYLPIAAGDVTRQRLAEIWAGSELFGRLRDPALLGGRCGACEFVKVCGGCRARAYYQFGDYLAEEPYCVYQPGRVRR